MRRRSSILTRSANVTALRRQSAARRMAVVKSDGMATAWSPRPGLPWRAERSWIGVIHRRGGTRAAPGGFTAPVLCLMGVPGAAHEEAVRHGVDLAGEAVGLVNETGRRRAGRPPRPPAPEGGHRDVPRRRHRPRVAGGGGHGPGGRGAGNAAIVGIQSHLACADMPGHPSIDAQVAAFRDAIALAKKR